MYDAPNRWPGLSVITLKEGADLGLIRNIDASRMNRSASSLQRTNSPNAAAFCTDGVNCSPLLARRQSSATYQHQPPRTLLQQRARDDEPYAAETAGDEIGSVGAPFERRLTALGRMPQESQAESLTVAERDLILAIGREEMGGERCCAQWRWLDLCPRPPPEPRPRAGSNRRRLVVRRVSGTTAWVAPQVPRQARPGVFQPAETVPSRCPEQR
jgi:hypothetical protein